MNMSALQNSVFAKNKKPVVRLSKVLKKKISELVKIEVCPNAADIMKILACSAERSEYILKEVKKRRKEIANTSDVKLHGSHTKELGGFIYLVENKVYPNWVKCGMTLDCGKRLKSYNTYDPMKGFRFLLTKEVQHRRNAEKVLLNAVAGKATTRNGEWFLIDTELCKEIFNKI